MQIDSQDDILFLQKFANFAKVSVSTLDRLEDKIASLEDSLLGYRKKEAQEDLKRIRLEATLEKAAKALYDADFITDASEKRKFLKLAKEDPAYLANIIEKICNAADVALIGSPARVASKPKKAEYDPVAARAFGWDNSNSLLDE